MPAAMHITVLVFLFAVFVCGGSPTVAIKTETTSAAQPTSLTAKNVSLFSPTTTGNTQPPPTTTQHISTASDSEKATSSSSTSPQTHNGTQATHFSATPHQTATSNQTANQTANQTISHQSTLPSASDSPNVTATTTANTTSPGLPQEWEKGDLNENPGLVAVLCIFCIVFVLVLVVTTVRCIGSSSNNFERLEDVPMNKVNEESPFARYSK